ncbi:hypothetical protein SELMODRAFT_424165 [Selaginella moellendorffii]|uniref:Senescence domain-containing protein n=1 Tax=Selaginella moellendorffii TaxID=88036 RepID=D8SP12_SELML|nr:uncharacterized protein LOC9648943 [Selaginella moellendorffii]EFJ13971.1 hypothetical protein SELMODRAFT_424165 [Selaginella moellendorffii]|eukprot:XP_002985096.1 uncharacterized protein LOC9648943 [Selaginella moellendorffii]
MGGQSSDRSDHRGNDIELLTLKNAQLFLVDQEESVAMQRGDFKLVLTKQLHSPLAAVVATVKDVEWPVGKDCPVLKLGRGCYSFCLPGFSYGLLLDRATPDASASSSSSSSSDDFSGAIDQLELFLEKYCTYEDRSKEVGARFHWDQRDEGAAVDFWNHAAGKVEMICSGLPTAWAERNSRSVPLRHGTGAGAGTIAGEQQKIQQAFTSSGSHKPLSLSPRMMKRVQQARRLSAIAKLFSRALLKGAINNRKHVTAATATGKGASDEAVASVDTFAKVVEAIECTAPKPPAKLVQGSNKLADNREQHQFIQQTSWTLNNFGLQLLIGAVAASTAINLSSSSSRPSSSSTSSTFSLPERPPLPLSSPFLQPASRHGFRPVLPQQSHQGDHH